MLYALTLYTIFQSLLFAVILLLEKKPENRPLALYFIYLFFSGIFFMLISGWWGNAFADSKPLVFIYHFIAHFKMAIVFYFLYSILKKPMPKLLRGLWLLPVLHLVAENLFRTLDMDFFRKGFYANWYLNFSFYARILFALLLLWQIRVFRKEIAEGAVSNRHDQPIKLYWGKYFVYFNLAALFFSLLYLFFTLANGRLYTINSSLFIYSADAYDIINQGFTTLFLLIFGYMALRKPPVFTAAFSNSPFEQKIVELVLPEEEKNFSSKTEFTEEQIQQYTLRLNKLMENDKVYLDPELSLSKLAKITSIPSRQLSQFIQLTFHKRYKDYINTYRTQYAQKLLTGQNASRYTMYSIAFDSGFNSESSFYTIFKQQTNLTPKQYQDKFKNCPVGAILTILSLVFMSIIEVV